MVKVIREEGGSEWESMKEEIDININININREREREKERESR